MNSERRIQLPTNNNTFTKWFAGIISGLLIAGGASVFKVIRWTAEIELRVAAQEEEIKVLKTQLAEEQELTRQRRESLHQELHKYHVVE